MEREVSIATMLAVSMCALATFISIVMVTVTVGNYIKASAYEEVDDMQVKVECGTLRDLRDTDKEMSVAAVFGIIQNSEDYIESIEYRIKDKDGNRVTDIQNNLSGRCRLEVDYNPSNGMCSLILHNTDCAWLYEGCSCGY